MKKEEKGKSEHPSLKGVKGGLNLGSKAGKKFIQEEKHEKMCKG